MTAWDEAPRRMEWACICGAVLSVEADRIPRLCPTCDRYWSERWDEADRRARLDAMGVDDGMEED